MCYPLIKSPFLSETPSNSTRENSSAFSFDHAADSACGQTEAQDLIRFLRQVADDTNGLLRKQGIGLEYEIILRKGRIYVAIFRSDTRELIQLFPYTPEFGGVKRFSQIIGMVLNQYA
jgi:hypothetical protein